MPNRVAVVVAAADLGPDVEAMPLPPAESPVERAAGPAVSTRCASDDVLANKPTVSAAPAESLPLPKTMAAPDFSRRREPASSGTAAATDGDVAPNADARTLPDGVLARSSLLPAMRERPAPASSGRKSMASSARVTCSSAKGAERGRPLRVSRTPRLLGSTGGKCTSRRLEVSASGCIRDQGGARSMFGGKNEWECAATGAEAASNALFVKMQCVVTETNHYVSDTRI